MAKKKHVDHSDPGHIHVMTLREVIGSWWAKKFSRVITKQPISGSDPLPPPANIQINHIAIVLDGVVEEVIRAENRLAALFLSQPQFVEFTPEEIRPTIGWGYNGERFIDPNEASEED
jgi:hypothetical protein